ncbi:hypothetical protein ABTX85_20775 [Streptomyces sp. NPDC096097]|uniref:hypothetical protein n=1 Tax=Streptomyces sp. NPDC096097 TaxID=3155546 RepID=UPI003316F807
MTLTKKPGLLPEPPLPPLLAAAPTAVVVIVHVHVLDVIAIGPAAVVRVTGAVEGLVLVEAQCGVDADEPAEGRVLGGAGFVGQYPDLDGRDGVGADWEVAPPGVSTGFGLL